MVGFTFVFFDNVTCAFCWKKKKRSVKQNARLWGNYNSDCSDEAPPSVRMPILFWIGLNMKETV